MADRSGGTRTGAQVGSGTGLVSPLEERLDLGLLVAAVAAERADRGEVAALRPAGDRLRVDLEQRTDLGRGEQWLVVERGHVVPFGWGSYSPRQALPRSRSALRSSAMMHQTPSAPEEWKHPRQPPPA